MKFERLKTRNSYLKVLTKLISFSLQPIVSSIIFHDMWRIILEEINQSSWQKKKILNNPSFQRKNQWIVWPHHRVILSKERGLANNVNPPLEAYLILESITSPVDSKIWSRKIRYKFFSYRFELELEPRFLALQVFAKNYSKI